MKKFRGLTALLCICCIVGSIPAAQADIPYKGYIYDAWGNSVAAPTSYVFDRVYSGFDLNGKAFKNPSDLFVSSRNRVYISDSGNRQVLVCDEKMQLLQAVTSYFDPDGKAISLTTPRGLFVDGEENLYIALPEEEKVIKIDENLQLLQVFSRPESDLLEKDALFTVSKVVANEMGTVFVLVSGLYLGAVVYNAQGEFLGFYGADDVVVTVQLLADRMWKRIMSQEQSDKMARYVPTEFTSFDIDGDNFIYTTTSKAGSSKNEITKLNSLGNNVLTQTPMNVASHTGDYGDLERGRYLGKTVDSQFMDVAVREDGLIFGMDKSQGRIFEYDQESRLLAVFGMNAYQQGGFQSLKAIDTLGEKLLALDDMKGTITVFRPTEYGKTVEEAILLYNDGRYQEARVIWEKVLSMNGNCVYAYDGIGKALYEAGDYEQALKYFRLAWNREAYSRAFKEYRVAQATAYLPYVLYGLLGLFACLLIWKKGIKRRRKQ